MSVPERGHDPGWVSLRVYDDHQPTTWSYVPLEEPLSVRPGVCFSMIWRGDCLEHRPEMGFKLDMAAVRIEHMPQPRVLTDGSRLDRGLSWDITRSGRPACKDAPMSTAYSYVAGDNLWRLILRVREDFVARGPYEDDETRHPNSIRLVAIETFEDKTTDEQLAVLRDVIEANPGLIVEHEQNRDVFEYSDTVASYITDLICHVVCQIVARDPDIRLEDNRRRALVLEAAKELDEQ